MTAKIDRDAFYKDWHSYATTSSYDDWDTGVFVTKRFPTIDRDKVIALLGYSPPTVRVLAQYAEYRIREAGTKVEVIERKPIPFAEIVDHRSGRFWKDTPGVTVPLEELARERGEPYE